MSSRNSQGFTLIELMIAITIIVLLVMLGLPSFSQWLANTKIRTAADSIQNGLRIARNEAVQRGTNVAFQLTGTGTADWTVCVPAVSPATGCSTIEQYNSASGASGVVVGAAASVGSFGMALTSGLPATVTFTSFGRVASGPARIDASSAASNSRRLVITISTGGQTHMCDPQISLSVSAQGCY